MDNRKNYDFHFRFTKEQYETVMSLAEQTGMPASDILRMLVNDMIKDINAPSVH